MKKPSLFILIGLFLLWNGSPGKTKNPKFQNLFFKVSKCFYGKKTHLDSIAFDVEKILVREMNIKIGSSKNKTFSKDWEAGDFKIQVAWNQKSKLLVRVLEEGKEIFLFTQKKDSGVKFIFYDKNSEPYLIETILTSGSSALGAGISRPPLIFKTQKHIK